MRKAVLFLVAVLTTFSLVAFRGGRTVPEKAKTHPSFLMISDVHVDTKSKSTKYGGDTGMDLWHAFLRKMDEILSGPDAPGFIVYTGDLPAHYKCGGSCYLAPADRAQHNADIDTALTELDMLANKYHKPLFYAPGNNDALAGDYYSFADENGQTPLSLLHTSACFFPKDGDMKTGEAPRMVSNPDPTMGYYSASPVKNLRLIVLNTVIFHRAFTPVDHTGQQTDGDEELKWLSAQLEDAAAKSEKVYIAMHIPPGMDAFHNKSMWAHDTKAGADNWQDEFLDLVSRYRTTVTAILYGHTHMDEIRRLYDSTGSVVTAIAISCPGVTPQHYNNPGFKVVDYDAATKQPTDFTTYYTTPDATAWGNESYTFSAAFGNVAGTPIYNYLRSMPIDTLENRMNRIYTVKHEMPLPFRTKNGIEVKFGQ